MSCRVWFKEAEGRDAGYLSKKILSVALYTTCYDTIACASLAAMVEIARKEVFEWILR